MNYVFIYFFFEFKQNLLVAKLKLIRRNKQSTLNNLRIALKKILFFSFLLPDMVRLKK